MPRRAMTYRVVPLDSEEASQAPLAAVRDRVAMVDVLSRLAWTASGRPFPTYTRATMPIRLVIAGGASKSTKDIARLESLGES